MPDPNRRDPDPYATPDYRACASSLHDQAEQAHSPEAKESLNRVARWYEVLAKYIERRRNPTVS